jgi:DNA-binding NarL/FixJ family response regulator
MMKITITDDDTIVVSSLKTILEMSGEVTVLGTGTNGEEAVKLFAQHQPDIVLIDIQMPVMTGLEAAEKMIVENPDVKVLFLTTFADDDYIYKALSIGAKGYILKQDFDNILPALKAVYSGQNVFGTDIVARLTNLTSNGQAFDYEEFNITEKEQEVILLVAEGLNNKEISAKLYLSEGTVRNYLSSVLAKLNLRDRTQLAIWYYQLGQTARSIWDRR